MTNEVNEMAAKKKRTITPEHLAKMQEGKLKAKRHRERVADAEELETRMRNAAREAAKPVRMKGHKRRRHVHK